MIIVVALVIIVKFNCSLFGHIMFLTSNTLINTNQQLMDRILNEVLAWFNNDGKGGDVADNGRLDLDHQHDYDRKVCIYLFNV